VTLKHKVRTYLGDSLSIPFQLVAILALVTGFCTYIRSSESCLEFVVLPWELKAHNFNNLSFRLVGMAIYLCS
jgi:hypothetical protein